MRGNDRAATRNIPWWGKYFKGGNRTFGREYTKTAGNINNNSENFRGTRLLLWGGFAPLAPFCGPE